MSVRRLGRGKNKVLGKKVLNENPAEGAGEEKRSLRGWGKEQLLWKQKSANVGQAAWKGRKSMLGERISTWRENGRMRPDITTTLEKNARCL